MDRQGALAERPSRAPRQERLDLRDNAEGDFRGRFGTQVETHGRVQPRLLLDGWDDARSRQISKDFFGPLFWAKEADI